MEDKLREFQKIIIKHALEITNDDFGIECIVCDHKYTTFKVFQCKGKKLKRDIYKFDNRPPYED